MGLGGVREIKIYTKQQAIGDSFYKLISVDASVHPYRFYFNKTEVDNTLEYLGCGHYDQALKKIISNPKKGGEK